MIRLSKDKLFFWFFRALVFVSRSTLFFSWLDGHSGNRPPLWGSYTTINRTPPGRVIGPSQRPLPDSDSTQHSYETEIHVAGGIRTPRPSKWAVANSRLSPRGHCNRPFTMLCHGVLTLRYMLLSVSVCLDSTRSHKHTSYSSSRVFWPAWYWRREGDNTLMASFGQQHTVTLWRTALCVSAQTDIRYSTFKEIDRLII